MTPASTENKDAEMQVGDDEGGLQNLTPSPDFQDGFRESHLFSENGEKPFKSFKNLSSKLKYLGDKNFFLPWYCAKEYPKLDPMEVSKSERHGRIH